MMTLRSYIIAISGLFIGSPLSAQVTGFYAGLSAGLAMQADLSFIGEAGPDDRFDCNCTTPPTTGRDRLTGAFHIDNAAIFGGALGYDFGLIRIDAALSYSRGQLGKFSVGARPRSRGAIWERRVRASLDRVS